MSGIKDHNLPSVSIIIPCRNEEKYIGKCLDSVVAQDYSKENLEVLVVDSISGDGTREIVKSYSEKFSFIKLLDNPQKITPLGLNIGIKESRGEIIIRLDVHAFYYSNYVKKCVEFLEKTGADNVGGKIISRGEGFWGKAIALALSSVIGVGNSLFRTSNYEGLVDTVPFGTWRRSIFDRFGLFDESLKRNQDDEFNFRIIKNGGKIFMTPEIRSEYYVRNSLWQLWRQYWQFGYFKVRVIKKHRSFPSRRALVPGGFLLILILLLILSLLSLLFLKIFYTVLLAYLVFLISGGIYTSLKEKKYKYIFVLPIIFAAIHFSYGLGFLEGIFGLLLKKK